MSPFKGVTLVECLIAISLFSFLTLSFVKQTLKINQHLLYQKEQIYALTFLKSKLKDDALDTKNQLLITNHLHALNYQAKSQRMDWQGAFSGKRALSL